MGIKVEDLKRLPLDMDDLFNLTTSDAQDLINDMADVIKNLMSHWKGSDADANIKKLIDVYNYCITFFTELETYIIKINESIVIPLFKHIKEYYEHSLTANVYQKKLSFEEIVFTESTSDTQWTDEKIIEDITLFSNLPQMLENILGNFETFKDKFLSNFSAGEGHTMIFNAFETFSENYAQKKHIIEEIKNNLDIVAANKDALMLEIK